MAPPPLHRIRSAAVVLTKVDGRGADMASASTKRVRVPSVGWERESSCRERRATERVLLGCGAVPVCHATERCISSARRLVLCPRRESHAPFWALVVDLSCTLRYTLNPYLPRLYIRYSQPRTLDTPNAALLRAAWLVWPRCAVELGCPPLLRHRFEAPWSGSTGTSST